ncbi:MAG TPA: tetratricopeptide repeat protein [Fimbriimonadaceae bacterium]|nr:tetratricopeptide repeat protein [Fimbriimonadaceae bacterium]
MKLAVLPFNAVEGTPPALGRQFSNFACDTIRVATGADFNPVSFLAEIDDTDGKRAAYVNISDTLLDKQWIDQLFEQSEADGAMDGLVKVPAEGQIELTVRFHKKDGEAPVFDETWTFAEAELFTHLHRLVKELAKFGEVELPEDIAGDTMDFGTDDAGAFIKFLEGYDALMYINQSNGRVAREFSPEPAIESLMASIKADPDFLGPYETLITLCRKLAEFRIGTFDLVEKTLKEVIQLVPDDYRGWFALGEAYQSIGDPTKSADAYEKAVQIEPEESALYTRLGIAQLGMNMPVNAERNFRKAVEMEGPDKPTMDYLAMVLAQTGRPHEVPALWKEQIERDPTNPQPRAKYAISLMQAGREDDGVAAFEQALAEVEDAAMVKRFFAPVLVQRKELDRAMDLYEDVLEVAPNDVQVLLEYANTLRDAGREFEIPNVLRDVLASNPDPNTRAQTLAWLLELQEPRRTEVVEKAAKKMEEGDFDGAIRDLKPLRNWLADYWKLWAMLAAAHNRLQQWEDAEECSRRLIELFPGCEPAFGEMSTALHGLERDEEAYNMMRWAAQNMPQSLGIHVNLALAASRAGHKEEATQLARQLREAVGPNEELEQVLAEIER